MPEAVRRRHGLERRSRYLYRQATFHGTTHRNPSITARLVSLSALLVYAVVWPRSMMRQVVYLLAMIPMATAALIYTFVGAFLPAHVFVVAAVLMLAAGTWWHPTP